MAMVFEVNQKPIFVTSQKRVVGWINFASGQNRLLMNI